MFGLILLLLIVVPIVELWVLFQVADSFGWAASLLLLLVISLAGGVLVRWQTTGAWGRIVAKIQKGEMPSNELVDGALMIFGGALLLTPGFFTDAIGLAMFIPPLRAIVRRVVLSRMRGRVAVYTAVSGGARDPFVPPFGPRRSGVIDVDEVPDDPESVRVTRVDSPPPPPDPTAG